MDISTYYFKILIKPCGKTKIKFPDVLRNVWFQKISIPSPRKGLEFPGGGGSKAQENPEGGRGCCINLYYFFQTGSIIPIC